MWWAPWEAVPVVWKCPPVSSKASHGGPHGRQCRRSGSSYNLARRCHVVGPLGGDPGAPTTYVEDVGGGAPWEAMQEIRDHPPPMLKTLMVGPLRGDAGDPRAPTTYVEDVDGGPPRRRCRRSESAQHICLKTSMAGPWRRCLRSRIAHHLR
jgi:hypothetical protein